MTGPTSHEVHTDDGWRLDVQVHAAPDPVAVAVLGHAMMVDRRSMDRPRGEGLASRLAARGIQVHLCDLRGHGASGPTADEGGAWSYDDIVHRDLPALVADARARHPELPVFMVGHSLAGHCSAAAAGSGSFADPPDGYVFFAVNVWARGFDGSWWRDLRRARDTLVFLLIALVLGRFPSRTLRMGPTSEATPYVRDLARFFFSGGWTSRDGQHDYLANLAHVRGPVLALGGAGDRLMAHPDNLRRWTEAMTGADTDVRILGVGDFGLTRDPGHMELVTDPGSAAVWDEVAQWIRARAAEIC